MRLTSAANPLILISISRGDRVIHSMLRRLFLKFRLLGFSNFLRNGLVGLKIEVMVRVLLRSRLKWLRIWTSKC